MSETKAIHDAVIYNEMLAHPALFTHPQPKKVAIMGDKDKGILHEVLKHDKVLEVHSDQILDNADERIHRLSANTLETCPLNSFDIFININDCSEAELRTYYHLLHHDGILIQQSQSLFEPTSLKSLALCLQTIGFTDLHILHFPQPHSSISWRSAIMALKKGIFKRVREKAIYNKTFKTHFYNHDIHRAALVIPEFMRDEFII